MSATDALRQIGPLRGPSAADGAGADHLDAAEADAARRHAL
ncbi:MAG TPA: hypothetical protein VMB73_21935 [Acetobacteraceae bacterium]|nr:hypothetical protein [Acetobacteraceae bacterium]